MPRSHRSELALHQRRLGRGAEADALSADPRLAPGAVPSNQLRPAARRRSSAPPQHSRARNVALLLLAAVAGKHGRPQAVVGVARAARALAAAVAAPGRRIAPGAAADAKFRQKGYPAAAAGAAWALSSSLSPQAATLGERKDSGVPSTLCRLRLS